MAKYDIYGDGTIIDISQKVFLQLLVIFINKSLGLAESYIGYHVSGLADFENEYLKTNVERMRRQYFIAVQGLEDKELKEQVDKLVEMINELSKTDDQIIAAYREAIQKNKGSTKPIQKLKKTVCDYLYKEHLPPPAIVKEIASETAILVPKWKDINNKAHARIEQLISLGNG